MLVFFMQRKYSFFFCIQPEFSLLFFLICCVWYQLSHSSIYKEAKSCSSYLHYIPLMKLKSRLEKERLHSPLQHTFLTDNKELFHCITFPPLRPNLAPRGAFSQSIPIISALFHCNQIWHILTENPQL